MMGIVDDLKLEGISEKYLIDNIVNIKKNCSVYGRFPIRPKYEGPIWEWDDMYRVMDFTKSFFFYMIHNRHLLNFSFEIVDKPTYLVAYTKYSNSTNVKSNSAIPTVSLNINVQPGVTRLRKLSVNATMEFIKIAKIDRMETIYNEILSDMNYSMLYQKEKSIYLFKLLAQESLNKDTIYFMTRSGISVKGMYNINPNGELTDIPKNSPWAKLGI